MDATSSNGGLLPLLCFFTKVQNEMGPGSFDKGCRWGLARYIYFLVRCAMVIGRDRSVGELLTRHDYPYTTAQT